MVTFITGLGTYGMLCAYEVVNSLTICMAIKKHSHIHCSPNPAIKSPVIIPP